MIKDFRGIIDIWDKPSGLADELDEKHGTVRQWYRRNSIPADRWNDVVLAAKKRGHKEVSLALLANLAASGSARKARAA